MSSSSAALQPIYNLAIAYKQGGQITVSSNTTLSISACLTRDSADSQDINVGDYFGNQSGPSATTVNIAVNGLNGLDTGTVAASTVYNVFAIMDQAGFNPSGFILSTSLTAPLFPNGVFPSNYSSYRHIGWAVTDASSHFLKIIQSGQGSVVQYTYDAPVEVLTSGTVASQTPVSLGAVVPAVVGSLVLLSANFVPSAANKTATICTSGGTIASSQNIINGQVATVPVKGQFTIPATLISGVPKIDYEVTDTSQALSLWVVGFTDYLL